MPRCRFCKSNLVAWEVYSARLMKYRNSTFRWLAVRGVSTRGPEGWTTHDRASDARVVDTFPELSIGLRWISCAPYRFPRNAALHVQVRLGRMGSGWLAGAFGSYARAICGGSARSVFYPRRRIFATKGRQ